MQVRLLEDINENGQVDTADAPPEQTLVELVAWSKAGQSGGTSDVPSANIAVVNGAATPVIDLLSAPDGGVVYSNVPPGDYTLIVWWEPGFVGNTASAATVKDAYQIAFTVSDDGRIVAPPGFPAGFPGAVGDAAHPDREVAKVGEIPPTILLNHNAKHLVPFPVSTGGGLGPIVGGVADVGEILSGRSAIALPVTGQPAATGGSNARLVLLLVGMAVMLAAIIAGAVQRGRRRTKHE